MSSTAAARAPSWRERENNKRRERRRRAISAKIFAGLRLHGNYKLPKHCDSNEVLKALCEEAGFVVEEDGTTYRKGGKRPNQSEIQSEIHVSSFSPSPCSLSHQASPFGSYNPSPSRTQPGTPTENPAHQNVLIPLLRTLNSSNFSMNPIFSSISAPVTPPLSSTPPRSPHNKIARMMSSLELPDYSEPASPTFNLVSSNPFVVGHSPMNVSDDFAFGIGGNRDVDMMSDKLVKAWEGETIHEEFVSDELELTLGSSTTRT